MTGILVRMSIEDPRRDLAEDDPVAEGAPDDSGDDEPNEEQDAE